MKEYEKLFKFAAKAGSLEGYLYERPTVESLQNWIGNIGSLYRDLPPNVQREIKKEFSSVLKKILDYGEKTLDLELRKKLSNLLLELQQ